MSTIKIKRSGTPSQAPNASNLAYGELGLNYADGKLYFKDTNDAIQTIGSNVDDLTATGNSVIFSNLPTTDPANAGQLYNDGGILKVSAG